MHEWVVSPRHEIEPPKGRPPKVPMGRPCWKYWYHSPFEVKVMVIVVMMVAVGNPIMLDKLMLPVSDAANGRANLA